MQKERRTQMILHSVRLCLCTLVLVLSLQSCEQKELCYDHSHMTDLRVDFDWSAAPEARPRTMVLRFYKLDGSHYITREFSSTTSVNLRIAPGEYKILFHNGELENIDEIGDSYSAYRLSTKSREILDPMGRGGAAPPRPDHSRGEPVKSAPEQVWAGNYEYVQVLPYTENQSVVLTPREVTSHYTIELSNVENMKNDVDLSAALTGLSESWSLSDGKPAGNAVTTPIALEKIDNHTLRASFYAFGHCHDIENKHTFSVYTSNNVYFDFDVTDRMHEASNPHEIKIIIDGLKLPEPDTGMSPDIDPWDKVVDLDINMH